MALYIPHSILHLARLLYVRPETFGPYYVRMLYFASKSTLGESRYGHAYLRGCHWALDG